MRPDTVLLLLVLRTRCVALLVHVYVALKLKAQPLCFVAHETHKHVRAYPVLFPDVSVAMSLCCSVFNSFSSNLLSVHRPI